MSGLPLATFDPDRVHGLIDTAIRTHDDPDRVNRMLRAGAQVLMRPEASDVIVSLAFVDGATPVLAALRARVTGLPITRPEDDDLDAVVELARVPLGLLGQPPQG